MALEVTAGRVSATQERRGALWAATQHSSSSHNSTAAGFSYDRWIQEDLAPWQEHGITQVHLNFSPRLLRPVQCKQSQKFRNREAPQQATRHMPDGHMR